MVLSGHAEIASRSGVPSLPSKLAGVVFAQSLSDLADNQDTARHSSSYQVGKDLLA